MADVRSGLVPDADPGTRLIFSMRKKRNEPDSRRPSSSLSPRVGEDRGEVNEFASLLLPLPRVGEGQGEGAVRRVILGIGNPLRRDDGVGLWVAERMRGADWEVIPAGQSVENALGLVGRLNPDLLVVVDAAEMGLPPGSVRRLPVEDAQRMLGSTHTLLLPFLLGTVRDNVGEIVFIGIQPADRSLGEGLTPEGKIGAEDLVALLRKGRVHEITPLAPADENSVSSPKKPPSRRERQPYAGPA